MAQNRWTQPATPPPPLFVGKAERNFVKQINDEVIEHVIGQQVLYFPIDMEEQTIMTSTVRLLVKHFYLP